MSQTTDYVRVAGLTDGALVRLAKQDFRELMNEPLVTYVDDAQAREIIARGGVWLDDLATTLRSGESWPSSR